MSNLTDEYQPYEQGSYEKQAYAIKLKNGKEYNWSWPNAGGFNLDGKDGGDFIPEAEVTHVKKAINYF